MVLCRILVAGPYADYQGAGTNRKVRVHSVGDIVLFPTDYATWLKNASMVEIIDQEVVQELDVDDVIEIEELETVPDTVLASDSAIEFASDNRVDLGKVKGSGKDGRVLLIDVRDYVRVDE